LKIKKVLQSSPLHESFHPVLVNKESFTIFELSDLQTTDVASQSTFSSTMRFLKIIISIIGFFGFYIHIERSFYFWKIPDCKTMFETVKSTGISLLPELLLFIIAITIFNFIIERKLEKRKQSKEFFWLFILQFTLLVGAIIYHAFKAYDKFKCN
jgi:hypothetical protein